MELHPTIKVLANKITSLKDQILTEEATKTAFILPFINLLGYDSFNPIEVVPEFTADVGIKKGEKVDYAIFQDGHPILIIECKHWKENLETHNSQLSRYFHVSKSRFALLTNGIVYRFYTDLEKTNVMDNRPFFEFDITAMKESYYNELSKFHKSNFDVNKIINNASSLKYTSEIKQLFSRELTNPSDEFVKFFARQVHQGILTAKVITQYSDLVRKATNQLMADNVNERLQNALSKESDKTEEETVEIVEESKIITTDVELEAFEIVKAILRRKIPISRIVYRDTQSYFGVLLDDNNRKPLCRLHLDGKTKYITLFGENKKEDKQTIESIDNIYDFEKELLAAVDCYEN